MEADEAGDAALVERLAQLINGVYAVAERGLWREGAKRTTPADLAGLIRAGEIVAATVDGAIEGCLRLHDVAEDTSEFGILVAAPGRRNTGIGNALLDFAEERSRARGMRAIRLELLVPREWTHPSKELLKGWYGRRGYRRVHTGPLTATYPELAPLLATPCDLELHEKPLGEHHAPRRS
jgi:GNAT superfamily N-acetyltransferase